MKSLSLTILLFGLLINCYSQKVHLFYLIGENDEQANRENDKKSIIDFVEKLKSNISYEANLVELPHDAEIIKQRIIKEDITIHKDIVIFYFSGSGSASSDRTWPKMELAGGGSIAMRDIIEILRPKAGKLNLIMVDCDNMLETERLAKAAPIAHDIESSNYYEQLFVKSSECKKRMFVKMASASFGQVSRRTQEDGSSCFLKAFVKIVDDVTSVANPRWGIDMKAKGSVKDRLESYVSIITDNEQKPRIEIDCPADPTEDEN